MQVPADRVIQRAQVAVAGQRLAQALPVPPLDRMVVARIEVLGHGLQLALLARLQRDGGVPGAPVRLDIVPGQTAMQPVQAFAREVEHAPRIVRADQRFQLLLATAEADDRLAAVAARRAPADPPGFQHHHPIAGFGQFQCAGQAGVAGPEHADIAVDAPDQRGLDGQGRGAGGVPAGRVSRGHVRCRGGWVGPAQRSVWAPSPRVRGRRCPQGR